MTFILSEEIARATSAWLAANTRGIPSSILKVNIDEREPDREPTLAERVLGRELDGDETMRAHEERELRSIYNRIED